MAGHREVLGSIPIPYPLRDAINLDIHELGFTCTNIKLFLQTQYYSALIETGKRGKSTQIPMFIGHSTGAVLQLTGCN